MASKYADLGERIIANSVLVANECWEWIGARKKGGCYHYPQITVWQKDRRRSKSQLAHRVAYVFFRGEIPTGYEIDHLCFNTLCVNPAHLQAKARVDNLANRRGYKKK